MSSLHLIIHGRVQGVGFRAHTRHSAQKLGLTGWVRNLSDGSVEILAQGVDKALASFRLWCATGPVSARVDRVEELPDRLGEMFASFEIR